MKQLILLISLMITLSADILKENVLEKIEKEKEKSSLESTLLKDSWINPLSIEGDYIKDKNNDINSITKRAYLNFNQDIFKSGGIYYTIEKAKVLNKLSLENYEDSLDTQKIETLKIVLNINKIDLQIKKQDYLIKNKIIEIEKKQSEYLNGTTNIEDLDTVIIEKNDLENQIEDLEISKFYLIKEFKQYSELSYEKIKPIELKVINLDEFLDNNKTLVKNKLNSLITKYDQKITSSSYLPKISIFSQMGYQNSSNQIDDDNFYNYGIKFSIPLDYNKNKNTEISKLNFRLSKLNEKLKEEEEVDIYKTIIQSLKHIDQKIYNANSTIIKYESIYTLTNDLVEGLIKTGEDLKSIENRLNSSKLDIDILNIDKQLLIYEISKNTQIRKYY